MLGLRPGLEMSEGGASKSRASLIVLEARSIPRLDPGAFCNADGMSFLLLFHLGEVGLEIVEPAFPLLAEGLDPVRDLFHRRGREPARTPLRVAPAHDEPGPFEHFQMFRNRRLTEFERRHQFRDAGFTARELSQDRPSGWIAKRVEGGAQGAGGAVVVYCHVAI